jgi:PAS domain S-box-containing protein
MRFRQITRSSRTKAVLVVGSITVIASVAAAFGGSHWSITAIATIATAAVLWPLIPKVVAIPSTATVDAAAEKPRVREVAMHDTDQLYRSLLEAAPVAMVIVDPVGRIDVVNAKAMQIFGYTAEEMQGQPIELLIPERFHRGHVAKRDGYISAPTPHGMTLVRELVGRKKDGTEFAVEINLNPLQTTKGLRVSSAIVDISKRKQLELEAERLNESLWVKNLGLEAANKELEAFSYSVSHDLRAPLRSIDGFSQALLEDCGENLNEQGTEYLRRVRAASQRMGQLIDDLLNLSRVARTDLRREQTDLSRIATEVCAEYQSGSADRAVAVNIASGVLAEADPRLMRIVMTNLLGNAWKFSGKKSDPTIEFGCTDRAGVTEYFVRDNGAGFDMAYAGKLFGAFQRLHSDKDFPGTGIGLATIQRIIHRHGGSVRAESAPGMGATFFFTLASGNEPSRQPQRAAA